MLAVQQSETQSLKRLSFDELLDTQVTSVSRKRQPLRDAAAAIAVIGSEDIRRSGATTLPETLRGVAGLHVAQTTASTWAISARGFSSVNSEKLLVLTDTRSIYTPLYSGVFWDVQDYLLRDIDRIEVIRGPGATQWGSNAVNGVINITSKSARDTQGGYFEAGAGDELNTLAGARYGGRVGDDGYYRVYGKYTDYDSTYSPGAQSEDDWHMARAGARADWDVGPQDAITVQGDVYRGTVGRLAPTITVIGRPGPPGDLAIALRGGNVLARWRRTWSESANMQLRAYYDRTRRDDPSFDDRLDTIDLDFQHRFPWGERHDLVWGLNYRYTDNSNRGKVIFALEPESSRDTLYSGFLQDEIALRDDLRITLGTKLEHNDFSGWELQPSLRTAWTASPRHMLWGAVSRAARVPTRLERDIRVDASDPAGNPVFRLNGGDDFDSEEIIAYELGHRWQAHERVFVDTALFYNDYDGLGTLELGTPFLDPSGRVIVPVVNRNAMDGTGSGIEVLLTLVPLPAWRLMATYGYIDLDLEPHGLDINRSAFYEGSTPKHQFGLRSVLDLPGDIEFDLHWRRFSDIESLPPIVDGSGIAGYAELDVRLAWRGWRELEVALVGRNLLHEHHREFGPLESIGEIERSVYAKVSWAFDGG